MFLISSNLLQLLKQFNGGYNWTNISEFYASGSKIAVGDNNKFWSTLTSDSVIKTVDFFQTYGEQVIPASITQIFSVDTMTVYGSGGWNTNLIKTTNGVGPIIYSGIDSNRTAVPTSFILYQNYPKPFNPQTTISFSLSRGGYVTMTIYDVTGKELFKAEKDRYYTPGSYFIRLEEMWRMASGLYLYELKVKDENSKELFKETKKMLLIK